MPVFSRATSDQLAALAGITREVKIAEGDVLFREGDAPAIHIVLEGELSLEPMAGGEPMRVAPATAIGVYETLGGLEADGWRGHVDARAAWRLRVEREAPVRSARRSDRPAAGLCSARCSAARRERERSREMRRPAR